MQIAAIAGAVSGALAYAFLARPGFGGDYFHVWAAARTLLAGVNPYLVPPVGPLNPGNDPLFYPLPALLLIAPIAWLPLAMSGGIFIGLSAATLAFVIARDGYERLPLFMGAPFLMAVSLGQWSPLVTAAALEPTLGFVFAGKPNLGLAGWLYKPTKRAVVGGLFMVAISLLVLPSWPIDWYRNISGRPEKVAPLFTLAGPLLLLAALRWRLPQSRLFLAMACIPQAMFFYDQLALGLIPRTLRQSLILSLASFGLLLTWFHTLRPGDLYVQKAIPYATALYFVALPILLLQRSDRSAINETISSPSTPPGNSAP